jgi:Tn3 transposase DDE domain-containing protein
VLIGLDRRTGFLDCFTHVGGAKPRSPELKRNLIAVLIAQATNLGLARTADACGIAYEPWPGPRNGMCARKPCGRRTWH